MKQKDFDAMRRRREMRAVTDGTQQKTSFDIERRHAIGLLMLAKKLGLTPSQVLNQQLDIARRFEELMGLTWPMTTALFVEEDVPPTSEAEKLPPVPAVEETGEPPETFRARLQAEAALQHNHPLDIGCALDCPRWGGESK